MILPLHFTLVSSKVLIIFSLMQHWDPSTTAKSNGSHKQPEVHRTYIPTRGPRLSSNVRDRGLVNYSTIDKSMQDKIKRIVTFIPGKK